MDANAKSILIVEDELPLLNTLKDKFKIEGYRVFTAQNGSEGLAVAIKEHPDIILLDLYMPKLNGLETLEQLRNDPWGRNVPVIVLTNLDDFENLGSAFKYGVADYLIKANTKLEDVFSKVKAKIG